MPVTASSQIKIIHADDHSLVRQAVKSALAAKPDIEYVAEARDGKELLDILANPETRQPHIILLNIQMPIMDGLQALPLIRKMYPGVKVIILSMLNDPAIIRKAMELGASSYLTKAASTEEIYDTIRECAEKWLVVNKFVIHAFWREGNTLLPSFNEKEQRVASLLARGETLESISRDIELSPRTTSAIIDRLKQRTNSDNLNDLISYIRDKAEAR